MNNKKIELFRCIEDGKLVTDAMIARGEHIGHQVKQPVVLSFKEKLLVWLGFIK